LRDLAAIILTAEITAANAAPSSPA